MLILTTSLTTTSEPAEPISLTLLAIRRDRELQQIEEALFDEL